MKSGKLLVLGLAIFLGGIVTAQESNVKKEVRQQGDITEAVFYHENGEVAQKGTYKNGKLHGEWVSYDQQGNTLALGKYANGVKTGKWFFWNEDRLSEVDFENNAIASVIHRVNENGLVSK